MSRRAARDLSAMLNRTFGISLAPRSVQRRIRVTIGDFDPVLPEHYELSVAPDAIDIIAHDDEAAMRALFHLQRDMLLERAPILARGNFSRKPQWRWRINYPLVHRPIDDPADYLDYPDAYLMNMARYGYNATYFYLDLFDFVPPDVEPLLAHKDHERRMRDLNRAIAHLKQYGIRSLFHMNTLVLPPEHKLFARHPDMRGARSWGGELYCLCSSSKRVLDLYQRVAERLFADAPDLAGAVALVGGECFLHCYSRPNPRTDAGTHCPACKARRPAEVVSGVINALHRGAVRAKPDAQVFCWQYSGFVWGNTNQQQRVIENLSPGVTVLETFEKDDWLTIDGTRSYVFDYSISQLGPSPRFNQLARAARKAKLPLVARTEASQNIELFVMPRLPVMQRWAERSRRIREANVDGVHSSWRFYGFCAQATDEIIDHFAWAQTPDGDALLRKIAARDFGAGAASAVVRAWKTMSDAFGHFPYSGGITGFPYFRGPMFIGPAHPIIFDQTAPTALPDEFYTPDPSLGEGFKDVQSQAVRRPNFFLDLTWTQPFGPKKIRRPLETLVRGWDRGVALLDGARSAATGTERDRLTYEHDLAAMIGCCFRTTLNLLDAQELRAIVTEQPCTLEILRKTCRAAIETVKAERANAIKALELSRRHSSFGFGSAYGRAFGPELIQAKIAHCDRLISHGINYFYEIYAFHIYGDTSALTASTTP